MANSVISRRKVLASSVAVSVLSGCLGADGGDENEDENFGNDEDTNDSTAESSAPQMTIDFDLENSGEGVLTHSSGDSVEEPESMEVIINGESEDWVTESNPTVSAGSQFDLGSHSAVGEEWSGETITLEWISADGSDSTTISTHTAPNE